MIGSWCGEPGFRPADANIWIGNSSIPQKTGSTGFIVEMKHCKKKERESLSAEARPEGLEAWTSPVELHLESLHHAQLLAGFPPPGIVWFPPLRRDVGQRETMTHLHRGGCFIRG